MARRLTRAIFVTGFAVVAIAASPVSAAPPSAPPPFPAPASVQSLFDFFGGARRPSPPPSATAYADPLAPLATTPSDPGPRVESSPSVSYCVRLCDGRFFPIQRSAATPVEVCNSFCPASRTKIFSGGGIEHAVARDGTRYADLGNAYAYRDRVVPGCTCNGKDAFGLANMKAAEDPTLRRGDVVATEEGFVAYSGGGKRSGDFTPINSASGVSAEWRRQLGQTKIAPASAPVGAAQNPNSAASTSDGNDRQARLER